MERAQDSPRPHERVHRIAVAVLLAASILTSACTAYALITERAEFSSRRSETVWLVALAGVVLAIGLASAAAVRAARGGERRRIPLAPLRTAFVFFSATCGVILLWLQPYRSIDAWVCFSLAGGAYALALMLAPRFEELLTQRRVRVLGFLVFQLALAPFVIELALRAWNRVDPSPLRDTGTTQGPEWIVARREEPGSVRRGFRVNSDGFFDRDLALGPRPEHLVVCIGDSFSLGAVPYHRHYTTLCERELEHRGGPGFEVYNVGVPGADPPTYEALLEQYALPLEPELIVIALFVGNDVDGSVPVEPPPFAHPWLDRHALRCLELARRLRILESERRAGATTVELVTRKELSIDEIESKMPWLEDPLIEKATLSAERFLAIELERAAELTTDGALDYSYLFARLSTIRTDARPIPVAVLLLPDQFQVDDGLWAELESSIATPGLDRDLPQRRIGAWLAEQGIPCVDLLPRLRALPPLADGEIHAYHLQDTHFNARGNEVAALGLADLIEAARAVPR